MTKQLNTEILNVEGSENSGSSTITPTQTINKGTGTPGVIYFSNVTNNTHRFVEKLPTPSYKHRIPIKGEDTYTPDHPYVLIVPSYGSETTGHVPPQVKKWLAKPENRNLCLAVIATGNINFGTEYGAAGRVIANKLNVPHLYTLELAGTETDVENVTKHLQQLTQN